jgi:glycine/D-amino acid oxidase-like deaminating enzyme
MHRRTLIKTGGAAILGLGLGGCGSAGPLRTAPAVPPRPPVSLAPPRVSWDRIIRTTVGLRPHRDGGFVLRADKLDDKILIHNYGHGGAGVSLAWGCGTLVGDLAEPAGARRAAVIGCGAPGLCTARQLQRRGYDVTIYAATVPPDTTSNMSWAGFTPTTALILPERRTPAWDAQFRTAAEISYRQLQLMVGPRYGVYWIDSYNATDDPVQRPRGGGAADDLVPEHLRTGRDREILGPGEHPFPTRYAIRQPNLAIEPSIYLDALVDDVLRFGGRIVIRRFESPRELATLSEPIIVNCTGLGSFSLFDDKELVPIKGQLTFLVPQPEVNYRVSARPGGINAGINPRSDGIVVGNSQEAGVWSLEPNEEIRKRNVDAAIGFFSQMRPPARRPGS